MAAIITTDTPENIPSRIAKGDIDGWGVGSTKYRDHVNSITIRPADISVRRLLEALPAHPASSRILDVGCGSGMVELSLNKHAPGVPVIATDYAQGMVDITSALKLPDVTTQLADAYDLEASNLQPGSFTHATCAFCLQFGDDSELGVTELSKIVQPGGAVVLNTWGNVPHVLLWTDICKELDSSYELDESVWRSPWRTKEDVAKTMEANGLRVVHNETTLATLIYVGADCLADYFFTGGNPAFQQIIASFKGDMKEAEARFRERLLAANLDDYALDVFITVGIKEPK